MDKNQPNNKSSKNMNIIYTDRWAYGQSKDLFNISHEERVKIFNINEINPSCNNCKFFRKFSYYWGLCINRNSDFFQCTNWNTFTCEKHETLISEENS